ncbi:ATP-binding protein [Thiobacillus sp.]
MQLLLPNAELIGIAVEGLEPGDQARASAETVEIADLTLYYGKTTSFKSAARVEIVQFKYSISRRDTEFRASDANKTIAKFAEAYRDHKKIYGAKAVQDKLKFELITNRPVYPAFVEAIKGIAAGESLSGELKKQSEQFKSATGLNGKPLAEFARKCLISGASGNLAGIKRDLSKVLVDWSATSNDPLANARLGAMKQMVRDKAGYAGTNRNVIRRTDVFSALQISDIDDLLPCPASLAEVGQIVERAQLNDAINLVPKLSGPLLIHAAGGVGKTVFLESLRSALQDKCETVFFDCFGGGAYRSPEDSRHLPKRGLIHIVNSLACRGLCDPVLPGSDDVQTLLKTFRRRLTQCVETLSRAGPGKELIVFLDAIDNAAEQARDRGEDSFPTLLLESFQDQPVNGVKLIASCRSHRVPIKHLHYHDFGLIPFTLEETTAYLQARLPDVREVEIRVAQARSGGNARILEYLLSSERGLLDQSEINNKIELDELIQQRIERALSEARKRGYKAEDTNAFLAGLAVLPPPVPLDEYAEAHGMELSAIESFASDLSPLLERTKYGLMFRDEPTETLVRAKYASIVAPLRSLAKNLLARQDHSVYAARSLPGLLQKLGDGDQLFKLAFDERFPAAIKSTVGKRNIRYARLEAAVRYAANQQDHNQLVHLLVELSTIASVDQRGADYILNNPHLVIAAKDVDATRRLFETRTTWQGTRHARLTIANVLSGAFDEAYRHAVNTDEWLNHYRQQDRESFRREEGPDRLDIAALSFFLITQKRPEHAKSFLSGWKDWYGYEVGEHLFSLLRQQQEASAEATVAINSFLNVLTDDIDSLAAALSFLELDGPRLADLVGKLSKACKKAGKIEFSSGYGRSQLHDLSDGLQKAGAIALSLGLRTDALTIALRSSPDRPGIWSFRDTYSTDYVFPFLFYVALTAAANGKEVREKDILPKELKPLCKRIRNDLIGDEFKKTLKERLRKSVRSKKAESDPIKREITYEQKQDAERFINDRLSPCLTLTKALAGFLAAPTNKADKAFLVLLHVWAETRKIPEGYGREEFNHFFQILGCQIATFALWARSDLKPASVKVFLQRLHEQAIFGATTLIDVVAILAKRKSLQEMAGQEAVKARSLIESEDDVTQRASLYANLATAILPASSDEAASYFRAGLEQMDAIGSGDYQFTNELLLFSASLKGDELDEQDFHTLTNICELNLSYEPEKFPWFAFGKGLARATGLRGLAKLSRWDDRSKISLSYTLLPYLTALIDDGKIEPEDALALNWLADPVELYSCNTATFAAAIDNKRYHNEKVLVTELIRQFETNNPGTPMESTVKSLASIARRVLGSNSKMASYLSVAHPHFARIRDVQNEHLNYRGRSETHLLKRDVPTDRQKMAKLRSIANRTSPLDEMSLEQAINDLNQIEYIYPHKAYFFDRLRATVTFAQRPEYVRMLSTLESLDLYTKLDELRRCKGLWEASSASLTETYRALGLQIIQLHADDLVSAGQLSGYKLKEISDLSGTPISILAVELIKIYAEPDSFLPGSVWLALASIVCEEAREGEGQVALKRLLNSKTAQLSSSVLDGPWTEGLYPKDDPVTLSTGLIWRMLGSPHAADRWLAAHSVRSFASFERWCVLDALVGKLEQTDAGPFQAPELPFYFMHAKLWLLIALARIALDNPKAVARYKKPLLDVAFDKARPHVLMRHFAAQAIRVCADSGELKLSSKIDTAIRGIDQSPLPRLKKKIRVGGDFYHGRPGSAPKPKSGFQLDYDFQKHDVQYLSRVFGKAGWEVQDFVSEMAHRINPKCTSMYDSGGRETSRRAHIHGMTSSFHTYGQQLGWHALFLTAGQYLSNSPVTDDWYYDEPWDEWLHRYLLTRKDGLWLSDGVDRTPLGIAGILLEKGDEGLILTGDKDKILSLVGLNAGDNQGIVVAGSWHSTDHIRINISSVLVSARKARSIAKQLIDEDPMLVWLPTYDAGDNGQEYLHSEKADCIPWIVTPSGEARLDDDEPISSIGVMRRPRITQAFAAAFSLRSDDPFHRVWKNRRGRIIAHSAAWSFVNKFDDEHSVSGVRLSCSKELLKDVLTKNGADLLLLINLQRYEKGYGSEQGKYTHTVAVIRITKALDIEYHKGKINHPNEFKF